MSVDIISKSQGRLGRSKILDTIIDVKQGNLTVREMKHNYIHSLQSFTPDAQINIQFKMNEDYSDNEINLKSGEKYKGEIVKFDYHDDGKLAVSVNLKDSEKLVKVFTDRFTIIPEQKCIGKYGIVSGAHISIVKADGEIDGMAGFIGEPSTGDGVAFFRNLRGEGLRLMPGDVIQFENTDYKKVTL